MKRPKIFISHSAHDDAAKAALARLEDALENAEFEVLLDRTRLDEHTGASWREALNSWLEICNGAVILVSRHALTSDWVRREANILDFRCRDTLRPFKLLVALLGDVTPEEMNETYFEKTDLPERQVLRAELIESLPERAVAEFAELKQRFTDLPAYQRQVAIAETIAVARIRRDLLEHAGERVGVDLRRWSPDNEQERAEKLSLGMLRSSLVTAAQAMHRQFVGTFPCVFEVFDFLEPGWVDVKGVEWLRKQISINPPPSALYLNASFDRTPTCYVSRCAFSLDYPVHVKLLDVYKRISEGPDDVQALVREFIIDALNIGRTSIPSPTDAQIRSHVERYVNVGGRLLLPIRLDQVNHASIMGVVAAYGPVTFLIYGGEDPPAWLVGVEPPCRSMAEDMFRSEYDTAIGFLPRKD